MSKVESYKMQNAKENKKKKKSPRKDRESGVAHWLGEVVTQSLWPFTSLKAGVIKATY